MSATVDLIQKLYIGYFGRAGDPEGLQYWVERKAAGMSDAAIAQSFSVQDEAKAMYGFLAAPSLGMGQEAFLEAVYQNLFERSIDSEGLAYYQGQLNAGRPVGGIILDIINGARNTSAGQDLTTVTNKLAVANYYTEAVLDANATWTLADDQADAIAVLADVTSATASVTTAQTLADNLVSADTVPVGSTFTLTTDVDAVSGTQGNDTITGVLGNGSSTFNFGDQIYGGSGTDTLNLLDGEGTAMGIVSMDGVEVVNVRTLVSGAHQTHLNASDWSGIATLTNASSVDDSTLNVSGLSIAADVTLYGEASIAVNYANLTSGTDTATVSLIGAGSARSAATYASANTEGGLASIDVDLNDGGLVDAVNIQASGTNYVTLEGGADLRTINVSGSGAVYMATDDLVTGFNAAGFNGTLEVTFNGASDVNAVGGAGNDTFNFGTTFSNSDSVNGGGGTDTIALTLGGFNRALQTTQVEISNATFNDDAGGTLNVTGSTVATYSLRAGSADADANVAGVANGAIVNLTTNANNLDDVSVGYASGAASGILNLGSATGAVALDVLTVTGVSSLAVNSVAGSAGAAVSIASANFGGAELSITTSGGEADLAITNLTADALRTLTITSNGSAGITMTSGLEANTALTSVTVVAQGSDAADVTLGGINNSGSSLSFNSLTLTGSSGADITVGAVEMGNGATAASTGTITMRAGNGSIVGTTSMDVSVTGAITLTLNLSAEASGTVQLGNIEAFAGTASTAASTASEIIISPITVGANGLVASELVGFGTTAGALLTVGAITVGTSAGFVLGSGGILVAANVANGDISNISMTLGADASGTFGAIDTTGGAVGNITLTVADSASASFGAINASSIGGITITLEGDGEADFAGLTAASNIGAITLSLTADADVTIAAISAGGDIGNIVIGNAKSATANFDTIDASSIGNITISGAGFVDFGTFSASRVGTIDASAMASGTLNIDLSGVENAVELQLGSAANTIISGKNNDVITLLGGRTAVSGNDTIVFSTSTQGTDYIVNFVGGNSASGGDQIEIGSAINGVTLVSGASLASGSSSFVLGTASGAAVSIASTGAAVNGVVVNSTAFASTASFISAIATGGSLEISVGTALGVSGNLLVTWTDGSDTYISLISVSTGASAGDAAYDASGFYTLAQLQGVTPGALIAANFDIT